MMHQTKIVLTFKDLLEHFLSPEILNKYKFVQIYTCLPDRSPDVSCISLGRDFSRTEAPGSPMMASNLIIEYALEE